MKSAAHLDRSTLALELRHAVQTIERWSQRALHRRTGTSLSPNETHLLARLATAPPQRMSDLAEWQGVDRSTMTMQITRLTERGLSRRTPDPRDRRANIIELTEDGRAIYQEYLQKAAAVLGDALDSWSDEELARLGTDLGRFAEDLENALVRRAANASARRDYDAPAERDNEAPDERDDEAVPERDVDAFS